MKKYFTIALVLFLLVTFSGIVLAEKITVLYEGSPEKQVEKSVKSNTVKEDKLAAKRIRDRADSNMTNYNSRTNEQMIRYRQFDDGEGEVKTGN